MSRRYRLYHLSDRAKAERILEEISRMEGVRHIAISDDLKEMDIETDGELLTPVMDRVVNICRKVSFGCEISYLFG